MRDPNPLQTASQHCNSTKLLVKSLLAVAENKLRQHTVQTEQREAEKTQQTYRDFPFEVPYFLRLSVRRDAPITMLLLTASSLSLSPEGTRLLLKTEHT